MNTNKIILDTDPDSAEQVTITLWKSANGNFYLKEKDARYDGCTHRTCNECGATVPKTYTLCDKCRDKQDIDVYNKREKIVWDGKTPIYSQTLGKYIINDDELSDHLEEELMLLSCDPVYLSQIPDDYWIDDLDEDQDLPKEIQDALNVFNNVIKGHGPVSWTPGKYAVTL
jgi:hypothetical protein